MSFAEKVVIITGASSGIGAAIAVQFAEQGAKVVLVARNETRLKTVAEKCQKHGFKPLIVIADVAKDDNIKEIVDKAISQFHKIDILINNAGIFALKAIYDTDAIEVFDRIMATNLRSTVLLTNLAAPHLIKTKGNIINISSIAAVDTVSAANFAYCTSKAGMDHFTRSAALDLGPKGVRVNTVNPGPVRTSILDNAGVKMSKIDDIWAKSVDNTVLGRVSDPEEVGDLVLFLASDKAKAITGSSHIIDNGVILKRNIKLE